MSTPGPERKRKVKHLLEGRARSLHDRAIFRHLSLAAFLAWVGLGSDGLSSSCYGPAESYASLHDYPFLGVFVAIAMAITVLVISSSYAQIIGLFPSGGGGYVVASKLLSPWAGAVSGCALLVDYVLTISISVASGTDALFSMLPREWVEWKLHFSLAAVATLVLLNIRGVRESVKPLVPIFLAFLACHALAILWSVFTHRGEVASLAENTSRDMSAARSALGLGGMLWLVLHAYSMGAGTYTGIEAVSNSMPILRYPRVHTARKAMLYMAISLALTAGGLMIAYLLFHVRPDPSGHRTLNAVLVEAVSGAWPAWLATTFVTVTLLSEAAILVVAAQTGFLGGPQVLASMALDQWLPSRLSLLSDRLVTRNGVVLMGSAAAGVLILTSQSVSTLIVLYSINVFITFTLSQAGMVRHWWVYRGGGWRRRLTINGLGLVLTVFILTWISVTKFHQGGWATLLVTAGLVGLAAAIRRRYQAVSRAIGTFNEEAMRLATSVAQSPVRGPGPPLDPQARTAVVLVSAFNGLGVHTAMNATRYFGDCFRNFVFVSVGVVDAGNFKGTSELEHLEQHIRSEADRYVQLMRHEGYYAEAVCSVGAILADELERLSPRIVHRFPNAVFFAGQVIFQRDSFMDRLLHNNVVFAVQRRLYRQGIPFVILPFRLNANI